MRSTLTAVPRDLTPARVPPPNSAGSTPPLTLAAEGRRRRHPGRLRPCRSRHTSLPRLWQGPPSGRAQFCGLPFLRFGETLGIAAAVQGRRFLQDRCQEGIATLVKRSLTFGPGDAAVRDSAGGRPSLRGFDAPACPLKASNAYPAYFNTVRDIPPPEPRDANPTESAPSPATRRASAPLKISWRTASAFFPSCKPGLEVDQCSWPSPGKAGGFRR